MKGFWDYVKGIAYIAVIVIVVYFGLAIELEWFPFNPKESDETVYAHSGYSSEWDEGYDEGYREGYWEGYDDGFNCIWEAVEEAVHYTSEWHPEEAMWIIDCYENGKPFYEDGSLPSKEDYNAAIKSLYEFYEYFYNRMYEKLHD